MIDAYGRTIDYLRLSVTELCDLRCVYCMPPEGVCKRAHGELCSLEELTELAANCVALGVKKIRLTGGEPLVRRGVLHLVEALAALKANGLTELTMTTNGQRLAELAAPLRAAGLDRLNVSLDTLRPERFRALTRGGDLDRTLAGLAAAEAAGFRDLRLNAVLLAGINEDELRDLALLARDRPLTVRFIELMPIGPGAEMPAAFLPAARVLEAVPELREMQSVKCKMQNEAMTVGAVIGRPPEAEAFDEATGNRQQATGDGETGKAFPLGGRWHPASPASRMTDEGLFDGGTRNLDSSGVARLYTVPGWAGAVGLIAPMSRSFCGACNRIRITADGKLKPCLHSAGEFPLRGLRGEALKAAILAAVRQKPAGHLLSQSSPSASTRPMNEIGG